MTVAEGGPKAPFSIATTLRSWIGRYSFPLIAPLYPWCVSYIAECWVKKYQEPFLKSSVWHDLGLNPGLSDHWQTLYPPDIYTHVDIYTVNTSRQEFLNGFGHELICLKTKQLNNQLTSFSFLSLFSEKLRCFRLNYRMIA